jgi:hypothetical protein
MYLASASVRRDSLSPGPTDFHRPRARPPPPLFSTLRNQNIDIPHAIHHIHRKAENNF